jgi:hypothetical protein
MIEEIRIGNLLQPDSFHQNQFHGFGRVTGIRNTESKERKFTVDYHYPGSWFSPIPLTPDILKACGFIAFENGLARELNEPYQQVVYLFNKFPLCLEVDTCRMPLHHIRHLHQLQNFYFSICDNELPVNLQVKA